MHSSGSPSVPPPLPVTILSATRALSVTVRFLGGYSGILEHWKGDASRPCPGVGSCPRAIHGSKTVWKGFAPVQSWSQERSYWEFAVLELTESLEELLAGRDLRGEVWHLYAELGAKGRKRVTGQFVEKCSIVLIPMAFDTRPVVCRAYHTQDIEWGVCNPTPRRLYLIPTVDAGPAFSKLAGTNTPEPTDPAELLALRKRLGAALGRRPGASPRGAGATNGQSKDQGEQYR